MATKPAFIRMPDRTRALLDAIKAATGMTATQIIIQAIDCLAEKYNVKLP